MDFVLMQNPGGDSVKKSKKRRKKGSRKLAVDKSGAETRERMDGNLEDSDNTSDYKRANDKFKKNLLETDLTMKLLAGNPSVGADSTENLSEGISDKKRRKRLKRNKKKAKIQKEDHSTGQTKMDAGFTENLMEGNVAGKRKRKQKISKEEQVKEDVQSMDQAEMHTGSTENFTEGDVTGKRKKKKKKKRKRKILKMAKIKDEVQSIELTKMDIRSTENLDEGSVSDKREWERKSSNKATIVDGARSMDKNNMSAELTEDLTKGNVIDTRKPKRKKRRKAKIKDDVQTLAQTKMDTGSMEVLTETKMDTASTEILAEGNVTCMDAGSVEKPSEGNVTIRRKRKRNAKNKDAVQSVDQTEINVGSTINLTEGNATGNRNGESSQKATIKDEVKGVDQNQMDSGSTENLAEGHVTSKRKRKCKYMKKARIEAEVQSMSKGISISNLNLSDEKKFGLLSVPLELEGKRFPAEGQCIHHTNFVDVQNGESEPGPSEGSCRIVFDEGKGSAEGRSVFSTYDARVTTHFSSLNVRDKECQHLKMAPITSIKRKLLVLDVNGLLADVVMPAPKHCRGDILISGRTIFRRSFCDDFLKFCFRNFDVGIWSSRAKRNVDKIVHYLLGDLKEKLLFCWDMSHCTQTGFKTLENSHKPLVCKELRKIWDNDHPNLPWKKGDYNESNTLLLDDSPYKALLNPSHTAIFPHSYQYTNKDDNSLGPEGDLRTYLEGLARSENVQKYVEQHPFGQKPINEQDVSWQFYAEILQRMSK